MTNREHGWGLFTTLAVLFLAMAMAMAMASLGLARKVLWSLQRPCALTFILRFQARWLPEPDRSGLFDSVGFVAPLIAKMFLTFQGVVAYNARSGGTAAEEFLPPVRCAVKF